MHRRLGGLRDELGKKGVVFDVDLILTPQGVLSGGAGTPAKVTIELKEVKTADREEAEKSHNEAALKKALAD